MARFDGIDAMDTVVLHHAPTVLIESSEDYRPVGSYDDARYVCWIESRKLWRIAGPIAFNILCNYGMNSFTSIFVGHIGDLELSAIAISLNVISNFSFGFLVSTSFLGFEHEHEHEIFLFIFELCKNFYGRNEIVTNFKLLRPRSWTIDNCFFFSRIARDGERPRDAMRAGIRCGSNEHVRSLHATFMDNSFRHMRHSTSTLHLRYSNPRAPRPRA